MDAADEAAYDEPAMTPNPRITCRYRTILTGCLPVLWALACGPAQPSQTPAEPAPAAPIATEPSASSEPAASAAAAPLLEPSAQGSSPAGPRDARSKDEIQRVIAADRAKVRACYDAALKANPGIAGDLVVSFIINPDGSVKNAEVNWSESELHVPELDSCTLEVVQALKFPPSSRGLESKVSYPFNFNPQRP